MPNPRTRTQHRDRAADIEAELPQAAAKRAKTAITASVAILDRVLPVNFTLPPLGLPARDEPVVGVIAPRTSRAAGIN
jgi:hypothetical protein